MDTMLDGALNKMYPHKMYPHIMYPATKCIQHRMYPASKCIQPQNVSATKCIQSQNVSDTKYILTKHLTSNPKTLKCKSANVVIKSAKFLFHIESAELTSMQAGNLGSRPKRN